jgi:thiol:disulfide interchange protein DsbC
MHKIIFSILLVLILVPVSSFGFSEKGQDCSKCHKLTTTEAATLLKDLITNVKVTNIRISPVKAMWELAIEANNKKGIVYVDFSKKHFVTGSIVSIKDKKNLTQERFEDLNRVDVSQVPLADAIVVGNKNAKHKVIVFTDPDCSFCKKLHAEIKKVVQERKDVAFYKKMFPLKIHPEAYEKSKTIVCEKSLEMLENAFEKKPLPKPKCETTAVDENIKLAEKLGISGTPALIMPDGRLISGYREAKVLKELIRK